MKKIDFNNQKILLVNEEDRVQSGAFSTKVIKANIDSCITMFVGQDGKIIVLKNRYGKVGEI